MIRIGTRNVGVGERPFIIAEMSGNHNQSLDRALQIVDAAAQSGANALKLQTSTPEGLTLNVDAPDFRITDPESPWNGKLLFELYQTAMTPWEWHAPIFERARSHGMIAFSTPFEDAAVDLLEELNAPCYKIASFENVDLPLIRRVAATKKPLIISTGMATVAEVDDAVRAARDAGCRDLVLLKCTSTYPATPENSNLRTIPHMRELFSCEVGLSDHTLGVGCAVAAVAYGASVIEKHFTLSRADGGVDSTFSLEPSEMSQLVIETERAWLGLGRVSYGPTKAERKALRFRRSLYVTKDMRAGDVLASDNVRSVRPGQGLAPKFLEQILGRPLKRDVHRGTALTWDLLD